MSKSFHLCRHGLLLAILVSLLGTGQEALAQFGLFDTVWTTNNFKITGSGHTTISNNDSLIFLFKEPAYGVDNDTSQKYILFRTMDLNDTLWYISNFPTQNEPLSFIENDSKILFESRTITPERKEINPCILTRNCENFQITDSVAFDYKTFPPNTGSCYKFYCGVSEVNTSVYYWCYCGATAIKGISYKVNYRTGQTTITTDSLPYFAMTISEDGQYVAGVYYTGGTASNVPYNEVIEVRKISDYSLVFRDESKYCDYTSNFYPYSWVTNYKLKFSKDNNFILLHKNYSYFSLYDISRKLLLIDNKNAEAFSCKSFSKDSKYLFYQCKIKNGQFENHIFNLESLVDWIIQNQPEFPILVGGSEGFIINDEFLLSAEGIATYDSTYNKLRLLGNVGLAKVKFDLNSIIEPDFTVLGILYPNPTNNTINLTFELQSSTQLNYSIYSETGQLIKLLLDEFTNPGLITNSFEVSEFPTGSYFLRITGERFSQTYKVIINR